MTTSSAVINSVNASSNSLTALQISTINAKNVTDEAAIKAKLKETEAEIKGGRSSKGSSKIMPTSTLSAVPVQSPAGLALLNHPTISSAMSKMSPEQKIHFVDTLNAYLKSVNDVKATIASAEDSSNPTLMEKMEVVAKAVVGVAQNIGKVANAAKAQGSEPTISIWYLLANFMANDIMGINEKEESAAMYQIQANSVSLESVNEHLGSLNPQLQSDHHLDGWKVTGFELGCAAAFVIGIAAAPFTGGLSLALSLGALAVGIAFPICNAEDSKKPAGKERFSFLSDDHSASQQQLLEASISQSSWSNVGTQTNQSQQTTMQLHVTQTSQIIVQAAEEFSQMIQGAAQAANTASR
jgi:hypothetical protein